MNNVAGVDVSKGKSMVTVLRPFGEVVAKPFSVGHTGSELKELANYLKNLDGETRVVMEHTGRYYEPVARFLHEEGIFVSAVNPKLIKDYGNNTLRKVKTDKADARKIARYGLDNWVELRQHTPMDTIRMQLKTLNRQQGLYSKTKTMMKNNLIALLDQTYPDVNALFDSPVREDGSQKWVDFATTFWHVDCVRAMSLTAFMAVSYTHLCFPCSRRTPVQSRAPHLIQLRMVLQQLPKREFGHEIRPAFRPLQRVRDKAARLMFGGKSERLVQAAQVHHVPAIVQEVVRHKGVP